MTTQETPVTERIHNIAEDVLKLHKPDAETPLDSCPHCGAASTNYESRLVKGFDCGTLLGKVGLQTNQSKVCREREKSKKLEAEVERMKEVVKTSNRIEREERRILQRWKEWGFDQEERANKAEAEVERLKLERDHALDMELAACAREEIQKAEVERLKANLRRAVEIAEIVGWTRLEGYRAELRTELDQLKATISRDKN